MSYSVEQNYLLFRTQAGAVTIPTGETVRLTAELPNGIPIEKYKTIRVYSNCRPGGTVPVSILIGVVQVEADELIFPLDSFTLQPGSTTTKTYDVPGRSIVAFATAKEGTGSSAIDFGVLGFGPSPCNF